MIDEYCDLQNTWIAFCGVMLLTACTIANSCELAVLDGNVVLSSSKIQPKCRFKQDQTGQLSAAAKFTSALTHQTPNSKIKQLSQEQAQQSCNIDATQGSLTCTFNGKSENFTLTNTIKQGKIASTNWQNDEYVYLGWMTNTEVLMGYIAFSALNKHTAPFFVPASQFCQYGLSSYIIDLGKGDLLCQNHEGLWSHSRLLPLPQPCQQPQQMIQDKGGIWALEFIESSYQWRICRYTDNAGSLLAAYEYSIDLKATLARYDLQPSDYTQLTFLSDGDTNAIANAVEIDNVFPVSDITPELDPQTIELPIQQLQYKLTKLD
ncbi:hypothetical protein CWB89_11940 [Pseudoalteromonas piscicida]|uniref:Uncharacterized protein n=1 Tax=Pseudoalteromonas piscicida TaxID=43662 RepID=A0AAQ2EY48_PSEO7|nr:MULTISPECIES: hypothetical protein [Pseudoalteromonas]KJY92450.1 hypothetical protein TW75_01785 [Pseudoalteromonas piscicida]TMN38250.1 hypothetical protein CWB95_14265 [Pseudoalteromonas piscicida]TMN39479.1 hypothetical protein CWB94_11185 [Pseudoalteromonas piscicida]TMN50252.1 hypothetical protein CWB91_14690 [Pseudoalteromonas piscicida]TMN52470.1 hypothetical protein CWB93_16470 [Pseudoalteromonas piscicida]